MATDREIVYLRGKLHWAKVLGDPVLNYNKDGKEWTFDLALDADGVKQAKTHKALNIKDKDDDRGKFVSFKQKELRANGDPNARIRIVDAAGNAWPEDKMLGNGTVADVKAEIRDYGKGKYPGIYPRAIRILDHVEFKSSEFAPLSSDDKFFSKASEAESRYEPTILEKQVADRSRVPVDLDSDEDLNDDIPE